MVINNLFISTYDFMLNFKNFSTFEKYLRNLTVEAIRTRGYLSQNDFLKKNGITTNYITQLCNRNKEPRVKNLLLLSKALTGDMHLLHKAWMYFNDRELYDMVEKESEENLTKLIAQQLPELSEDKIEALKEGFRNIQK